MQDKYKALQGCIFTNQGEFLRFRQIIVNSVLATDIFDKELKALRNLRWDKAFYPDKFSCVNSDIGLSAGGSSAGFVPENSTTGSQAGGEGSSSHGSNGPTNRATALSTSTNRKATIVIEHIIQASDVAHTMQHWK